jgi:hypothetical protein
MKKMEDGRKALAHNVQNSAVTTAVCGFGEQDIEAAGAIWLQRAISL